MKFFKVLQSESLESVPWALVEPYRERAFKNHYQSLEELHKRGGLSLIELYCVLTDQQYKPYMERDCLHFILKAIGKHHEI